MVLLDNEETDPYKLPDYDGFVSQTFCGSTARCGRPAHEVLDEELALLGAIAGRDLAGELRAELAPPDSEAGAGHLAQVIRERAEQETPAGPGDGAQGAQDTPRS